MRDDLIINLSAGNVMSLPVLGEVNYDKHYQYADYRDDRAGGNGHSQPVMLRGKSDAASDERKADEGESSGDDLLVDRKHTNKQQHRGTHDPNSQCYQHACDSIHNVRTGVMRDTAIVNRMPAAMHPNPSLARHHHGRAAPTS
jgi:hypothetical protein